MENGLLIQILRLLWISTIFFASFSIILYLKKHISNQVEDISKRLFIKQQGIKLTQIQKMDSLKSLGLYILDYITMIGLIGITFYYYWSYKLFGLKFAYIAIGIYISYFIINYILRKRKEKKEESD